VLIQCDGINSLFKSTGIKHQWARIKKNSNLGQAKKGSVHSFKQIPDKHKKEQNESAITDYLQFG
jgi:hypothetical protein